MKLIRYGAYGGEKPGLVDGEGALRDLSHLVGDFSGVHLIPDVLDMLSKLEFDMLPKIDGSVRIGACVGQTRNIIGIDNGFAKHNDTDIQTAKGARGEPVLFNKAPSCIVGANDPIMLPKDAKHVDWEIELAAVIGRRGSHLREDQVYDYIAGYCILNDVTERHEQQTGAGQLVKSKSAPTFGPLGPWLVTSDEIPDPHKLEMWTEINGKRVQTATTSSMLFSVPEIVSYVSRYMALEPGDIISIGAPFGSGFQLEPQVMLKKGDRVKLGIEGLGAQEQKILAWID